MKVATTGMLSRFTYAAAIAGAMGVLVLVPATAHAVDDPSPNGGCTYTDAEGYPVPIDDGQDVLVDRKVVGCRGGKIVIPAGPKKDVGTARSPVTDHTAPEVAQH